MPAPVPKPILRPPVRSAPEPVAPAPKAYVVSVLVVSWAAKLLLIAWPLGEIVAIAFRAGSGSLTPFIAWAGLLAFAFQLYLLCSSGSDLAAAVSRWKDLPVPSFIATYRCGSLTEFWQLVVNSFNPRGWSPWFGPLAVVLVAWPMYGYELPQIAWMLLMSIFLFVEQRVFASRAIWHRLPKPLRSALTFAVLLVSGVLLRAATLEHVVHYGRALIGHVELTETALIAEARFTSDSNLLLIILSAIVVIVLPSLQSMIEPFRKWKLALAVGGLVVVVTSATPVWNSLRYRVFTRGHEKVFAGRGGWFFDTMELNAITGSGALEPESTAPRKPTSAAPATVLDFAQKLQERGVPLLLIPLPLKASLYPEFITGSDPDNSEAPLYHACQPPLYEQFSKAGIDIQDLTQAMLQLKERKKPVFWKQDSHWTPEVMQELARQLAIYIRKKYREAAGDSPMIIDAKAPEGTSYGDLVQRARLDGPLTPLSPEQAVMVSFPSITNDPDAPLALIGGDDVRIYDDPHLGFSDDGNELRAGFAQHLSLYLGERIDTYTQPNPQKAFAQRLDDDVRAKKLVVWILPARDLIAGPSAGIDWSPVTFNPGRRPPVVLTPMVPGAVK